MAGVYGRIGGMMVGFDLRADYADGRITGRMGDPLRGKDLDFRFDGATLSGRWGGAFNGKDLHLSVADLPWLAAAALAAAVYYQLYLDRNRN